MELSQGVLNAYMDAISKFAVSRGITLAQAAEEIQTKYCFDLPELQANVEEALGAIQKEVTAPVPEIGQGDLRAIVIAAPQH